MNTQLADYIKQQLQLNVSKKKITDILLGQGWQRSDIDEAFLMAEGKSRRAVEIDYSNYGDQTGEYYNENGENAGGRKTLIFISAGALALLIFVGIIFAVYPGGKKTPSDGKIAQGNEAIKTGSNEKSGGQNQEPASTQNTSDTELSAANQVIASELSGTITPPAGWKAVSRLNGERVVVIFNKPTLEKDNSGAEIFNENINITRGSITSASVATADEYIAKSKQALQQLISDYKFTADKTVKLNDGTSAKLLGSAYTLNGVPVKNMQLFAIKGDDVYIVTGISLASNWDKEKDMIGESVLSFKYPAKP